jgi:hypothetical protein
MVYNVAAILCLQFVVHAILFAVINCVYLYISTLLLLLLFIAPTHINCEK